MSSVRDDTERDSVGAASDCVLSGLPALSATDNRARLTNIVCDVPG